MKMTAMWKSITTHNLDYSLGKLADQHGSFLFTTSVPGFVSSPPLSVKSTEIKYMSIYVHLMITQYLIDLCKSC